MERDKRALTLIIEAFSVVTGISFMASALINALAFWAQWRLVYFFIAGPADVIMSGLYWMVKITGFTLAVAIGLAIALILVWAIDEHVLRGRFEKRLRAMRHEQRVRAVQGGLSTISTVVASYLMVQAIAILGLPGTLFGGDSLYTQALPSMYPTSNWYEVNLIAISGGGTDCPRAPVLWLGSSAAVLQCPGSVRVIHKLDALVTEHVRPQ